MRSERAVSCVKALEKIDLSHCLDEPAIEAWHPLSSSHLIIPVVSRLFLQPPCAIHTPNYTGQV